MAGTGDNHRHCECAEVGVLRAEMASWYDPVAELPYVDHAPGECRCTHDLKLYRRRDGGEAWLCSCCCLPSDKEAGP